MKIKVKIGVSVTNGVTTIDTEELGYSEKLWNSLSKEEKEAILQDEVFELSEQPYWMIDSFEEK